MLVYESSRVKLTNTRTSDEGSKIARRAIEKARDYVRSQDHVSRIPFKIFATLDNAIFQHLLQSSVYLNWTHEERFRADVDSPGMFSIRPSWFGCNLSLILSCTPNLSSLLAHLPLVSD